MQTELSPVEEILAEIDRDLDRGQEVLDLDQMPNYAGMLAVGGGRRALAAVREVMVAMADLEPGPALAIHDALKRGLEVAR